MKATLRGKALQCELPITVCRDLVTITRAECEQIRTRVRTRARASTLRLRERARRRGYRDGLAAAQREIGEVLARVRSAYDGAVQAAEKDTLTLALKLAEQIVEHTFSQEPLLFKPLLMRAVELLRKGQSFLLQYNERYTQTIQQIAPALPAGIILQPDPSMRDLDFVLTSNVGSVESAWRTALAELHPDHQGVLT